MEYTWPDFVGNIGVFCVLLTYFLLQIDKMDAKGLSYSLLNGIGAILICISLYYNFNLSSVIIEIFWLAISIFGIYRALSNKSRIATETTN